MEMIGARTRATLQAAKVRGTVLGGWKGGFVVDGHLGAAANRAKANAFAVDVGPMMRAMRDRGLSLGQIAAELAKEGIQTARGGQWTAAAVRSAPGGGRSRAG